jgi:condensin complex subunit 3
MFYRPGFFKQQFTEMLDIFSARLESNSPVLQRIASIGMTKLYFAKCLTDFQPLTTLLTLFFTTGTDSEVTQCLAYFFSVFPYTSLDNQRAIASVSVDFIKHVSANTGWNVATTSIAARLCEWTDSARIVGAKTKECVHLDIVGGILESLAGDPSDKIVWGMLSGMRFFGMVDSGNLEKIKAGIEGLFLKAPDTRAFTALKKVTGMLELLDAQEVESEEEEEEMEKQVSVEADQPVTVEVSEDEEEL